MMNGSPWGDRMHKTLLDQAKELHSNIDIDRDTMIAFGTPFSILRSELHRFLGELVEMLTERAKLSDCDICGGEARLPENYRMGAVVACERCRLEAEIRNLRHDQDLIAAYDYRKAKAEREALEAEISRLRYFIKGLCDAGTDMLEALASNLPPEQREQIQRIRVMLRNPL